jgi:hypothetical protein
LINKGSWIQLEELIYCCGDMPVKIYIRGNCLDNCEVGEETSVKTITGHVVRGIVSRSRPLYNKPCKLGKDAKEVLMMK